MQPNLESPPVKKKPSDAFRAMADRIDLNAPEVYGGAIVAVPPDGTSATALEILFLDASPNSASQFWFALKNRCDLELNAIAQDEARQAAGGGFPVRR